MKIGRTFSIQRSTFNAHRGMAGSAIILRWILNVESWMFPTQRRNRGSAVLIVLALLALIVIFSNANTQIINSLRAELRLIEQRQLKHWSSTSTATNAAPTLATNATTIRR